MNRTDDNDTLPPAADDAAANAYLTAVLDQGEWRASLGFLRTLVEAPLADLS